MADPRKGEYYVALDDDTDAAIQAVLVDMMHRLLKEDMRVSTITMGGLMRVLLQTHPAVTGQPIDRETVPQGVVAHVRGFQKRGPKPKAARTAQPQRRANAEHRPGASDEHA